MSKVLPVQEGLGKLTADRRTWALELLLHLNPPTYFKYLTISIGFEEALLESIPVETQPVGWTEKPPRPTAQQIGDLWVKRAQSAVLQLPSVFIPSESKYLLSPAHSDFKQINVGKAVPFTFDTRLL